MIQFEESGHPVFRVTSPLSPGTLKSKGVGNLSTHFCDDGGTIETVFRTIISVHQLSIYGAVSDLCEDYQACHARTWRLVLAGQSLVWASKFAEENTYTFDHWSCTRIYCKSTKNEWRGPHWQQLESDSTPWQRTLKNSHNAQNQWHVLSTFSLRDEKSYDPKGWIRGNTKIGPVLEVTTRSIWSGN